MRGSGRGSATARSPVRGLCGESRLDAVGAGVKVRGGRGFSDFSDMPHVRLWSLLVWTSMGTSRGKIGVVFTTVLDALGCLWTVLCYMATSKPYALSGVVLMD